MLSASLNLCLVELLLPYERLNLITMALGCGNGAELNKRLRAHFPLVGDFPTRFKRAHLLRSEARVFGP